MPIQNQTELYAYLERLLPRAQAEVVDQVSGRARFERGRCRGMSYGPLKALLTLGQFEGLLIELGVTLPIGARNGSLVRIHEYPTGDYSNPCVPRDDCFCN